jgi:uncharacterized membrane protein YphA (DoxX/SURF4 family)
MFKNPLVNALNNLYGAVIYAGSNLQSLFLLYMRLTWAHQFFLTDGIYGYTAGFLLFIGFLSRLAAIPLIVLSLIKLSTVHAPDISEFRFLLQPALLVKQPPYPYLITGLLIFIFGPGRVSVDAWIKRWVAKQPKF